MSREIKFRAWHNKHKEYLDGSVASMFRWLEEGQSINLEQYTGLKDKNGVEIYEKDKLRCQHNYIWIVGFNSHGCFVAHDPDDEMDFVLLDDWKFEVIGNIHQNPELLG